MDISLMNMTDQPTDLKRPDARPDQVALEAGRLRELILRTVARTGEGYLLQGLGAADLFAALFFSELRVDPSNPEHPLRDRFVLSTAHNSVALYAALAQRGILAKGSLSDYGADGSPLEIIGSERVPGVEGTFGSLGQGLSVAIGMGLAARLHCQEWRTYVVLGDGEMQEGQIWEAAMAAAAHGMDNLCLIVDSNGMQVEGSIEDVLPMGDVVAKWKSFGWAVSDVDGHDAAALLAALSTARRTRGRPAAIVARTEPGHPISFLRGQLKHYATLSEEKAARAIAELPTASAMRTSPSKRVT